MELRMSKKPNHMPSAFSRGVAAAFAVLALLPACSSSHSTKESPADEPIEECDAFLGAYEHCLDSLGPASIAQARVEQTRAGFVAQAGHGEAARAALRQKCADNLSQLKTTCR